MNLIIDPKTLKKHSIFSKQGKNLLKSYVKIIQYGGVQCPYNTYPNTRDKENLNGTAAGSKLVKFNIEQTENRKIDDHFEFSDPGSYIFIIDQEGNVYATSAVNDKLSNEGGIHHSSFGWENATTHTKGCVQAAGTFIVNGDNKIVMIDNQSGHFKPPSRNSESVYNFLKNKFSDLVEDAVFYGDVRQDGSILYKNENGLQILTNLESIYFNVNKEPFVGYSDAAFFEFIGDIEGSITKDIILEFIDLQDEDDEISLDNEDEISLDNMSLDNMSLDEDEGDVSPNLPKPFLGDDLL